MQVAEIWGASRDGKHEVIEWLMASGRDLGDVKNKKAKYFDDRIYYSAIEIAKERNMTEVVSAGKLHRRRNTDSP